MSVLTPPPSATKKSSTRLKSRTGHWIFIDKPLGTRSDDCPNESETFSPATPKSVTRHPKFFFDNILVAIQIEDTLFNVHKYQLAKSEVFSDMFRMPMPEDGEPEEGSSPENPIVLKGVAATDFVALLTVLYTSHFSSDQPTPDASLIVPAFRIANMFDFSELRAYLLPLAEKTLNDVDKIVFAREFDIKEWLTPAHVRLCQRAEPLSEEEANKLGVQSVLIISHMREKHRNRIRTSPLTVHHFYCYSCLGMGHFTNSRTCSRCNGTNSAHLRYNGAGIMAQNGTATNDDSAIEAGVKRWVENGCSIND
ncbi:hypothetical protein ACGC1H_005939 [Rhizoctonia solani]|uniref:BTB domain-containing protein n=1 Tax=Rhizoctonia solani TaxID=456999 RepID=A0A8H3C127_9AGAM|nr:unnamed protein product [Rhizoctonia solani]